MSAWSGSGEDSSCLANGRLLAVRSHGLSSGHTCKKKKQHLSLPLLIKALIPLWESHSHEFIRLNYISKAPSLNTITLGSS